MDDAEYDDTLTVDMQDLEADEMPNIPQSRRGRQAYKIMVGKPGKRKKPSLPFSINKNHN